MLGKRALRRFDWILFLTVLALVLLGCTFIGRTTEHYTVRQLQWLAIGLVAFLIVVSLDYTRLGRWAYPAYAVVFLGLVLLLIFGVERNNARRWFRLFGFNVQPSELAKIVVVLALARYLMYRKNYRRLVGLIPPMLLVLVPTGMILLEPDLGTAVLFLPTLFVMLYAAGASLKHLGIVVASGLACTPLLWFTVMSSVQKGRILGFLRPESDPLQTGWHVRQSLAAITSGGVTGHDYASVSPVLTNRGFAAHTDFIFSVIAHEWGFLGALGVLLLLLLFFSRVTEIAAATREPFGRLVVVGMLTMLGFQALVNIAMTLRLCPITGLTLPFVSYGGSSLLTCFIMVAFIINIGMRRKPVVAPEDFA